MMRSKIMQTKKPKDVTEEETQLESDAESEPKDENDAAK